MPTRPLRASLQATTRSTAVSFDGLAEPPAGFFDIALEAAEIGTWRYTLRDHVCLFDARAQELHGVESARIVHDPAGVVRLLHPDDVDRMWQAVAEACNPLGDGRYKVEYRTRRRDGGWRWLTVWGLVEFDADGPGREAVAITGASRDITERRRTELFHDAQKQSLEMIVGGVPLAEVLTYLTRVVERQADEQVVASILFVDDEGRLRDGASPSLPASYTAAIDGLKVRADLGTCSVAAATGEVVITPDIAADPRWATIGHLPLELGLKAAWSQPITARDGRVLGTFGTYFRECRVPAPHERQAVEILSRTAALAIERSRGDDALRESDRRLQTLVANLPGMAYRCALQAPWPLTYASEGVQELSGYPATEFTSGHRTWQSIVHPEDVAQVQAEVDEALANRCPFELMYRLLHADGSTRWVLDRGRGVYERAGAGVTIAVAIEGFVGDLTRQREAEEALRDADRRKDEFIATLSHELRNPLAPLRTALHLKRTRRLDPSAEERLLGTMERQVGQLVRLVDDLLEVARISRGTLELRTELIDVASIVRLAVETSQPVLDAAGHQLTIEQPVCAAVVNGDRVRLAQVLSNVLNNAAKYTEPAGRIVLQVRVPPGAVEVAVRDTGAGIHPDVMPQLFELFARGERAGRQHREGLGVGLALARRLAEMHGGTLTGTSDGPGKGSEFTLRLPRVSAAATASSSVPIAAPAQPLRSRVLVVDDNVDAAEMTELLLRGLGCEVYRAHDGRSGIRMASEVRPDVVLLDIGLPDVTGHEVCRRIRQEPWAAAARIVAVTGWGQARDRAATDSAGFDAHLVKPVAPELFAALLQPEGR